MRVVLLRGRRRGVLSAGCAGVLVCAGLAVWSPSPAAASAVVGCPIPAGELAGVTVAPALVPTSWPSPVPLPAGVTIYGTGEPGGGVYFSAGPSGAECTAQFSSADGGFVTSIAAAGATRPEVESVFSAGGVGPETDLACAYIPAVHQVDIAFRGGDYCPRPPASDSITQVPTGDPALVAATVLTDPGTTDPRLGTSGTAGESTVAVVVAHIAGTSRASGQLADCTLPASQLGVCVAALQVFVAQSVLASSAPVITRVSSALASIAAPTPRQGGRIVVMGDSYASGEGTYNNGSDPTIPAVDYYPQTATAQDHCHRSPQAYGPLLGVAAGDFVACSGATTGDMINGKDGEPSQLTVLSPAVTTVILSAGGDDLGFATVLTDCTDVPLFAAHSYTDCQNAVNAARAKIPATIGKLSALYARVESATNGARLIVVGYPRLFPAGGHFGCNWIDEPRQSLLNDAANTFDDQIKAAVGAVPHATFVDTRSLFTGHEVCGATATPYINDLQTDEGLANNCPSDYLAGPACSQSYHPNVLAYRAEAKLLQGVLSGQPVPSGSGTPSPTAAPTAAKSADCYDIDAAGLDSRPAAQYCAAALTAAGFTAAAHTNATGAAELTAAGQDAVFYAVGHSASDCPGEWNSDGTQVIDQNEATGASILAPGTDPNNPDFLTGPGDLGTGSDQNCFPNTPTSQLFSDWATPSGVGHADLVVLQACQTLKPTFTGTNGGQLISVGQQAYDAGAQTVVGFTDEVQFQGAFGQYGYDYGIASPYRPTGDIWAHTLWDALAAGVPIAYAVEDATAQESLYSGGDGYLSWRILTHAGAPATLSQIQAAGP